MNTESKLRLAARYALEAATEMEELRRELNTLRSFTNERTENERIGHKETEIPPGPTGHND